MYTLEEAQKQGAVVTGYTFESVGVYTLTIVYESATISYTYEVVDKVVDAQLTIINNYLKNYDNNKPKTMYEVVSILSSVGYDIEKVTKTNEFVYNMESNKFQSANTNDNSSELWYIVHNDTKLNEKKGNYSVYLAEDYSVGGEGSVTPSKGFDAGNNTSVTSVTYENNKENAQDVIIRTNSVRTNLNINTSKKVTHYGVGSILTITNVNSDGFKENGTFDKTTISQGKIIVNKSGFINEVTATNNAIVENEGFILKVTAPTAAQYTGIGYYYEKIIENLSSINSEPAVLNIINEEEFYAFRDRVNVGIAFKDFIINLPSSLKIKGAWIPIGDLVDTKFEGTLCGASGGTTIEGLSSIGYIAKAAPTVSQNGSSGVAYGLIGYANNATIKNITIKGANIEQEGNVNFKPAGFFVGSATSCLTIENCYVDKTSKLSGNDKLGSFIGQNEATTTITNCTNSGAVTSATDRAAGFIGQITTNANGTATFTNCTNNGNITTNDSRGWTGGFIGHLSAGSAISTSSNIVEFNNCDSDFTKLSGGKKGAYVGAQTYEFISLQNSKINGTGVTAPQSNIIGINNTSALIGLIVNNDIYCSKNVETAEIGQSTYFSNFGRGDGGWQTAYSVNDTKAYVTMENKWNKLEGAVVQEGKVLYTGGVLIGNQVTNNDIAAGYKIQVGGIAGGTFTKDNASVVYYSIYCHIVASNAAEGEMFAVTTTGTTTNVSFYDSITDNSWGYNPTAYVPATGYNIVETTENTTSGSKKIWTVSIKN